jgi:hypothetical protein
MPKHISGSTWDCGSPTEHRCGAGKDIQLARETWLADLITSDTFVFVDRCVAEGRISIRFTRTELRLKLLRYWG